MDPTETTPLIDVVFVLPCLERDGNLARQIYMYTSQLVPDHLQRKVPVGAHPIDCQYIDIQAAPVPAPFQGRPHLQHPTWRAKKL